MTSIFANATTVKAQTPISNNLISTLPRNKKIPLKLRHLTKNAVFSFQRSFKEQLEVYSSKHFPESEVTEKHVSRVNLIYVTDHYILEIQDSRVSILPQFESCPVLSTGHGDGLFYPLLSPV